MTKTYWLLLLKTIFKSVINLLGNNADRMGGRSDDEIDEVY